jgi:hypothetical protein
MKRLNPEVPIVLLAAWPNLPPGYDQADRLLNKGITTEEFLAEIANLLSNHNENTRHSRVSIPPLLVACMSTFMNGTSMKDFSVTALVSERLRLTLESS